MFKQNTDEDISDTEYNEVIKPHIDKVNNFHETYLVPEISAYYIATGYYNNALYEDSLLNHITSCTSTIDMNVSNEKKLIANVKELLLVKYGLEIENENPLIVKKI